jgi:hypothetical protein
VSIRLADNEQVTLTLTDDNGNPPTGGTGDPEWLVDNDQVLTLEPAGLDCVVKAVGPLTTPGTFATVTANIKDADGNNAESSKYHFSVVSSAKKSLAMRSSEPILQSAAAKEGKGGKEGKAQAAGSKSAPAHPASSSGSGHSQTSHSQPPSHTTGHTAYHEPPHSKPKGK